MKADIILIGPVGAGKSTVGRLLSQALALPQVSMDELRWDYYGEIGYDEAVAAQKRAESGFPGVYQYWKPFEAYAVERLLGEHENCVIDLGAGHSVFEDDTLFARVAQILAPYRNVVLLLPSPDLEEAVRILKTRTGSMPHHGIDFVEHFVTHHSNHDLAKLVVYTKDKTPEETCEEIIRRAT